jgi:hypothetical protein
MRRYLDILNEVADPALKLNADPTRMLMLRYGIEYNDQTGQINQAAVKNIIQSLPRFSPDQLKELWVMAEGMRYKSTRDSTDRWPLGDAGEQIYEALYSELQDRLANADNQQRKQFRDLFRGTEVGDMFRGFWDIR